MLTYCFSTCSLPFRIASILLSITITAHTGSAQSGSFVADTLLSPGILNPGTDAQLHDFRIDQSGILGYVHSRNDNDKTITWILRYDQEALIIDTLFPVYSIPKRAYHDFDSHGQVITVGFGFDIVYHRFLITSINAGRSWDVVDIGDTAFYLDLKVLDAETWLLESGSPFTGWRFVTRDTAYWISQRERTRSSIRQIGNDSIFLFIRSDRCRGIYDSDTAHFQFMRVGDVADDLTPIVSLPVAPAPVPTYMVCPQFSLIGFDGRRIWFTRAWFPNHIDSTLVWPTAVYSYEVSTGVVQYEYFFPRPDSWPRAILFEDHVFVSLDSQLVYRHIDDPSLSPFREVAGVHTGLANLQVHNGALYGSRSSGLIMKISQISSVPTAEVDKTAAFTAQVRGSEIAVFAIDGATPRDIPLELFDVQGRRLSEASIASGSSSGRLPAPSVPGVYFLRCGGSEALTTLRILIP